MKCIVCNDEKLSKEFPRENIIEECQHPTNYCLRCIINHLTSSDVDCPYKGCKNKINDSPTDLLEHYQNEMNQLYPPIEDLDIEDVGDVDLDSEIQINITTLTGDSAPVMCTLKTTVEELKMKIQGTFKVAPDKQQLLYNDVILEPFIEFREARLADFKMRPGSTVHLMVLLYAIPPHLNHVIFDLVWDHPNETQYLDASCLVFNKKSLLSTVDFENQKFGESICHTEGSKVGGTKKQGHQQIEVHLKDVPINVTHLYFTLSTYNAPSISSFKNPCLNFYEASNSKTLCKTTLDYAGHSDAFIMCFVQRTPSGQWFIYESKKLSTGSPSAPTSSGPKLLDLVFAMDCTGSMGSYINEAKQNITKIADYLTTNEKADIKFALIEYRDHPPQDTTYVTQVLNFTSLSAMKQRLNLSSANGGGDTPEAVADALNELLKLTWRENSAKICVFIADAPPHGLHPEAGDGFPNGCPLGLDPMSITDNLARKGVTLYVVGCEPNVIHYRDWYMGIARKTGGQYVPLKAATLLPQVIIAGAQEELSLQNLMEDVNQGVEEQLASVGDGSVDQDEMEKIIFARLKSKGVSSKRMVSDKGALPDPTDLAIQISECGNMSVARTKFLAVYKTRPSSYYAGLTAETSASSYTALESSVTREQCARMARKAMAARAELTKKK